MENQAQKLSPEYDFIIIVQPKRGKGGKKNYEMHTEHYHGTMRQARKKKEALQLSFYPSNLYWTQLYRSV